MVERGSELNETAQPAIPRLDPPRFERFVRVEEPLAIPAVGETLQIVLKVTKMSSALLFHTSTSLAAASVALTSSLEWDAVRNISSICEGGNRMPRSSMAL